MSKSRDELIAVIIKLKQRILEAQSMQLSEQDTRQGLINPLLRALGWDFSDFDAIKSEFRPEGFRDAIDYVLFRSKEKERPAMLIEAKQLGVRLNDGKIIKQICSYMGQSGAKWGVLSDGDKYVMYNSGGGTSYEDWKFLTLQLSTADTEDGVPIDKLADQLIALIHRDSLENNSIQEFYKEHAMNRHIEEAMWSLFSEPFDTLAGAIQREFRQERVADPKFKITKTHIIEFLCSMKDEEGKIPIRLDVSSDQESMLHDIARISQAHDDVSKVNRSRRITMSDLLAEGLIKTGDSWRISYKGEVKWGRITANGELQINEQTYGNPSIAATVATGLSGCSGWNYWHFKNKEGRWVKIIVLRDEYFSLLETLQKQRKEWEKMPKTS